MPSNMSHVLRSAIRGFRPLLNNLSLEMERAGQDVLARNELNHLPPNMVVAPVSVGEIRAEWFHTLSAPEDEAVIYFHGGAYMAGSLVSNRPLAVDFAEVTGRNVLSFEYRLAPEHPFPAALADAADAYRYVIENGIDPARVAFVGDSAGGGLEIATALWARDHGLPLPAAIVALSPWTDLTLRGRSYMAKQADDPLLEREKLIRAVMYYAYGQDLTNPYISPLYGSFTGFPPTLIHVGTDELLLDDARGFAHAMRRDGSEVYLEEWRGMWHVWHVFGTPESKVAMKRIANFILSRISPLGPPEKEAEELAN